MDIISKTYLHKTRLQLLYNWSVYHLLEASFSYNEKYKLIRIGNFLTKSRIRIIIEDGKTYQRVKVKINNRGVEPRNTEKGENIGTKKQYLVKSGQFLMSKIDARNGAFGLVPNILEGAIVTNDFPVFDVDMTIINPEFLVLITTTKEFIKFAQSCSSGTTNRQRIDIELFLNVKIPLPSLAEQNSIVEAYNKKMRLAKVQESKAFDLKKEIEKYLFEKLGINLKNQVENSKGLQLISFNDLAEWGLNKIYKVEDYKSSIYESTSFIKDNSLATKIIRGKSPKYDTSSKVIILNQKCNRWNNIVLEYAKGVNRKWFETIDSNVFTQVDDILVNSTGEGTIGRASIIRKSFDGLLFDSHMLLLRVDTQLLNPHYYVELFNSSFGQKQVDKIKSAQSTKQTELGVNNIRKIVFPIPPIEIQNEIAQTISQKKAERKELKKQAENNRQLAIKEFESEIFMK